MCSDCGRAPQITALLSTPLSPLLLYNGQPGMGPAGHCFYGPEMSALRTMPSGSSLREHPKGKWGSGDSLEYLQLGSPSTVRCNVDGWKVGESQSTEDTVHTLV